MIFKLKEGQKPGQVIVSDGKHVGKFNERGYLDITDGVHIAKMKRAGYQEVTLRTCECGAQFEGQGEYMTHVKTCEAHLLKKEEKSPKEGGKKNGNGK